MIGPAETENLPLFRTTGTDEDALRAPHQPDLGPAHGELADRGGEGWPPTASYCHTFWRTGITTFLENGGDLETAQHIAGHASANTTRIYDHRDQKVAQEEIERVRI